MTNKKAGKFYSFCPIQAKYPSLASGCTAPASTRHAAAPSWRRGVSGSCNVLLLSNCTDNMMDGAGLHMLLAAPLNSLSRRPSSPCFLPETCRTAEGPQNLCRPSINSTGLIYTSLSAQDRWKISGRGTVPLNGTFTFQACFC